MTLIGHTKFTAIGNRRVSLMPFFCIVFIVLSACSGGSGSNNNPDAEPDLSGGMVNGFHLVKSTRYNEFDQIFETRDYLYDFELNQIDVTATVSEPGWEGVITHRNFYDQYGRKVRRESDGNGGLRESSWTFDSAGRILSYEYHNEYFDTWSTSFEYDALGRLSRAVSTELFSLDDPGYLPRITSYSYNANGFLESSKSVYSYDDPTSGLYTSEINTTFFTNASGQRIRTEAINSNTDFVETRSYVYDANGNMVERTLSGDYFSRTVYEYEPNQEPIYNHWERNFKFFPY